MGLLGKLLVLLAVLLMPFGMASTPAGTSHHAMMTDVSSKHCPDQGSGHDGKGGIAECTMACAAALPALGAHAEGALLIVCDPLVPRVTQALHGLHPDPATPPPKRS